LVFDLFCESFLFWFVHCTAIFLQMSFIKSKKALTRTPVLNQFWQQR
jgi:hypothetical protein